MELGGRTRDASTTAQLGLSSRSVQALLGDLTLLPGDMQDGEADEMHGVVAESPQTFSALGLMAALPNW